MRRFQSRPSARRHLCSTTTALALLVSGSAVAQEEGAGVIREGGNGVKHFYGFDGYMESAAGCERYGDNPNVQPGRAMTGTIVGNMWLENGTLFNDGPAKGTLSRDGTFHLDYPKEGPARLRSIDGRIGEPDPDGGQAPVTGTWTAPYPNGTSDCLTTYVITKGSINLAGGFGVALTGAKPSQDSGIPLGPIAAGLLAAGLLGGSFLWLKRKRRPKKTPCDCSGQLIIGGRDTLRVCGCTQLSWGLDESDPRRPALLGFFPDSDVFCARVYRIAQVRAECVGGGSIPNADDPILDRAGIKWDLRRGPGADELTLSCQAKVWVHCPGQEPRQQQFSGELVIKLQKVKSTMSFVVNKDQYYTGEVGHTGVRISCGEYDTIFGFYPHGTGLKADASYVAGMRTPGKVLTYTSRDDRIKDDVSPYYQTIVRREHALSADCEGWDAVRKSWKRLTKTPGDFDLYKNNCTIKAIKLVHDAGVKVPNGAAGAVISASVPSPALLSELLEKGGLAPTTHAAGTAFAAQDH